MSDEPSVAKPAVETAAAPSFLERWRGFGSMRRLATLRSLLFFLLAFGGNLIWQNREDVLGWFGLPGGASACAGDENKVAFWDRLFYKQQTRGLPVAASETTALVLIGEHAPPDVYFNVCAGRRYMAAVLNALATANIKAIAIDKYYVEGGCPESDSHSNQGLREAIQKSRVPIVVGQPTHAAQQGDASCVETAPMFNFRSGVSQGKSNKPPVEIQAGLLELNADPLKIPLQWPVISHEKRKNHSSAESEEYRNSFAATALLMARDHNMWPDLKLDRVAQAMDRLNSNHVDPVGRFQSTIPVIEAADLLCDVETSPGNRSNRDTDCLARLAESRKELENKLVVIGDAVENDQQPFFDGKEYGAMLHARYIDALLSGKFMKQVPFWAEATVWLVLVAVLAFISFMVPMPTWGPVVAIAIAWLIVCIFGWFWLPTRDYYPPIELATAVWVALLSSLWNTWTMRRSMHLQKHLKKQVPQGADTHA